mgnify:CR=1 FL=1
MIEEILRLGFGRVELGYDLTMDLVPGVMKMVADRAVVVDSLHNFCPVPVGAPIGHPELFQMCSLDPRVRESAVRHTARTVQFAAEVGARTVVAHAGNVDMKNLTPDLISLCDKGEQYSPRYEKIKLKLLMKRDDKAKPHLDCLCRSLDDIMPVLTNTGVRLALENLPSWESIPCESEMESLLKRYDSPLIAYWHDIGHGQIRQNLGFISYRLWLDRLAPRLAGLHIHDVAGVARDHLMPPHGTVDFPGFKSYLRSDMALVIEPAPRMPEADIREGVRRISEAWGLASAEGGPATERTREGNTA